MTPEEIAHSLREAEKKGNPIAPIREHIADIETAYAVQEVNTQYWLGAGRYLTGRKIGLTSKAMQEMTGVSEPDFGMLFSDMAYSDGEIVPVSKFLQPRIEGEIAFYLKKGLDSLATTIAEVISAVEYAVVAFEIVDSRIAEWDIKIEDTVADNASAGAYVLGTRPVKLSDFDHLNCAMQILYEGEAISTGTGAACLGNPLNACLWLAKKMIAVGRPLNAGDLILSGALGPMVPVEAGGLYELQVDGLGSVRAHFGE